ncbi:hypothetical protein AT251_11060 [Enterovibrio nigricans]|nr:hypothetical protein [Enterovibrio nigricans]PKF50491.1 hypothetical protein AT251_11060 [Enterovibrio nigricans]
MGLFNKRYLCCCVLSALSFSATAEIYDFVPSKNKHHDEPIEQGWENDLTGDAYGEAIKKKKRD